MGSFPITLWFDSLGWHINTSKSLSKTFIGFFFFSKITFSFLKRCQRIQNYKPNYYHYSKDFCYIRTHKTIHANSIFYFLGVLFRCVLLANKNILFVNKHINYNYLPITNSILFNRTYSGFLKLFAFFRIGVVIFIGLQKTIQIRRALRRCGIICIVVDSRGGFGDLYINSNNNTKEFLHKTVLQQYIQHF